MHAGNVIVDPARQIERRTSAGNEVRGHRCQWVVQREVRHALKSLQRIEVAEERPHDDLRTVRELATEGFFELLDAHALEQARNRLEAGQVLGVGKAGRFGERQPAADRPVHRARLRIGVILARDRCARHGGRVQRRHGVVGRGRLVAQDVVEVLPGNVDACLSSTANRANSDLGTNDVRADHRALTRRRIHKRQNCTSDAVPDTGPHSCPQARIID